MNQFLTDETIRITHCPTAQMIADLLTKPLGHVQHVFPGHVWVGIGILHTIEYDIFSIHDH